MISIIISSYNQAEYLPDAIESCLRQTVKPHEIIVVNDGATDNSLEVALRYVDRGVKVVTQVNKGLASARNTGIMNATGKYILPLDADDMFHERTIETLEKYIKETRADIIAPSMKCFGIAQDVVILMPNPRIEDFKVANRVPYACAIKRERLLEVGGYSPRMTYGYEDLHLWYNLLYRGAKLITMPDVLFYYRTKKNSMYHDAVNHHQELMLQIHKDFPDVRNIINDPLPK